MKPNCNIQTDLIGLLAFTVATNIILAILLVYTLCLLKKTRPHIPDVNL
jgi:hypothetical protein